MKWRRWWRGGALVIGAVGLASSGPVSAGDVAPPDIDQEVLDALRAEIPEGFPGESDLTEASEEFGRLVALYGQSTQVGAIGSGSKLTGLCGGYAYSYDKDGALMDAAMDVGDDGAPIDLIDGGQASEVDVTAPGSLQVTFAHGATSSVDLHNVWRSVEGQTPDHGKELLERFIASLIPTWLRRKTRCF